MDTAGFGLFPHTTDFLAGLKLLFLEIENWIRRLVAEFTDRFTLLSCELRVYFINGLASLSFYELGRSNDYYLLLLRLLDVWINVHRSLRLPLKVAHKAGLLKESSLLSTSH